MSEYTIKAKLEASTSQFKSQIDSAIRVAKRYKQEIEHIKEAKLRADSTNLRAVITRAKEMLRSFSREKAKANIDIASGAAVAQIRRLKLMLRSIPNKIHTQIVVSNNKSIAYIAKSIKKLGDINEVFDKQMAKLAKSINAFGTVLQNQIQGAAIASFSALIPLVGSLLPVIMAVGNAIAVVGGGAIGLVGAFGIAGAGVLGFGLMAKTALKLVSDGYVNATAESLKYNKAFTKYMNTWDATVMNNQASIFKTMANGLNIASSSLQKLAPFLKGVSDITAMASRQMLDWVNNSKTASKLFEMMGGIGVTIFGDLLNAAGRFGDGYINIFTQFAPLFKFMSQGLQNMSIEFQKWANSVSTANGIKSFIEYTKANLPVIGRIFGNVFMGLFNLFKAFGSNSQGLFGSLEQMTAKFKQWSEGIAQSDGFKKFIEYFNQNGGTIITLIGAIANAFISFITATAPLGQFVLRIITLFAQFFAKLMEFSPVVGMIIGVIVTLIGVFMNLLPTILLIVDAWAVLGPIFGTAIAPVLGVIAVILVFVGVILYLWKTNEGFRNAVITIWNAIVTVIMTVVNAVVSFVMQIWGTLVQWWQQNNQMIMTIASTVWNAIVTVIQTVMAILLPIIQIGWQLITTAVQIAWTLITTAVQIGINLVLTIITVIMAVLTGNWSVAWQAILQFGQTVWNLISSAVTSIFNAIASFLSNTWNTISSTASAAWSAVYNFISSWIQRAWSTVSSIVGQIWSFISSTFSQIVSTVQSKMSEFASTIRNKITEALNAAKNFVNDFTSAGRDLIMGMVNGVKDAAKNLIDAAVGAAGDAINAVKAKLGIKSPSRVFKQLGVYTMQGMGIGVNDEGARVIKSVTGIARAMTNNFNPNLTAAIANVGSLDGSIATQIQHTHNVKADPRSKMVHIKMDVNNDVLATTVNGVNAKNDAIMEF